jgi:enamine deaminase RidA (YjgF/YER057c/UK114 family)
MLLPPGWPRPKGYSNGISASGRLVFTAGIVGWDETERFVADDMAGQFRQVLLNTLAVLPRTAPAPSISCALTWYVTDRDEYVASLPEIGAAYASCWKARPGDGGGEVSRLDRARGARIRIETIAWYPGP